jgi:hypothetical protein
VSKREGLGTDISPRRRGLSRGLPRWSMTVLLFARGVGQHPHNLSQPKLRLTYGVFCSGTAPYCGSSHTTKWTTHFVSLCSVSSSADFGCPCWWDLLRVPLQLFIVSCAMDGPTSPTTGTGVSATTHTHPVGPAGDPADSTPTPQRAAAQREHARAEHVQRGTLVACPCPSVPCVPGPHWPHTP